MCLVGFIGPGRLVGTARKETLAIFRKYKSVTVGKKMGLAWKKNRFLAPYLRNTLWDFGYAVDTPGNRCYLGPCFADRARPGAGHPLRHGFFWRASPCFFPICPMFTARVRAYTPLMSFPWPGRPSKPVSNGE